jgi:hypothetical protein
MDEQPPGETERSRRPPSRGEGAREENDALSPEELEAEGGDALPPREAMSLLNLDVAIPPNPSIAADVLAGDLDPAEAGGAEQAEDADETDPPEDER